MPIFALKIQWKNKQQTNKMRNRENGKNTIFMVHIIFFPLFKYFKPIQIKIIYPFIFYFHYYTR